MFSVLKNLANSEKAVASGVLVLASSAMVITGQLSPQEWMSYTKTLLGIYVGGKTVQGAVSTLATAKKNESTAKAELKELKAKVGANDADADKALADKFSGDGEES